jgi:hypothetical protein
VKPRKQHSCAARCHTRLAQKAVVISGVGSRQSSGAHLGLVGDALRRRRVGRHGDPVEKSIVNRSRFEESTTRCCKYCSIACNIEMVNLSSSSRKKKKKAKKQKSCAAKNKSKILRF